MKRLICLLMTLGLLMTTVSADLLWEPENRFYKSHKWLCEPEERVYWVNGKDGYVTAWEEPDGRPLANLKNGFLRYVYGTYEKDGVLWGLISISANYDQEEMFLATADEVQEQWGEVWVPMSDMVLKYDHISFLEDHPGEVMEESREISLSLRNYCTYEVPCGPLVFHQTQKYPDISAGISLIYVDEQGREWGYCGYFYQDEVWFCLNDLENPNLQTEDFVPDLIPAAEKDVPLPEWNPSASAGVLTAAIVALCGITAVLIFYMGRKGRK